ncbi:DNA polymerase I [Candidatus Babeliales bacterium]|nr:DNA polymerase I [Candidatus Babeliales bacterium]MBP9843409.1 DNA polymerase I [Candidatus Babeliales bacterium]
MSNKSPIFIIDGSSFLYRAYYAMRPLQTSKGMTVQAVYGFCRMIRKLIKDFKIDHIVIVWDSKGKNIRHEIFPEYKATRQAPPTDLFEQKELIIQFLQDLKIQQLSQSGIEADDLIYSLARKFHEESHDVVIVSGDKDLAQMVNHTIKIFDPFKDKFMGQDELEASYGFPLYKLPFYFSILGDTSDNIPGVKGIGTKGATDLVNMFESLDDLYANINKIDKRRTKELLVEQKDNAYLSLKLFTLQLYPVSINVEDTKINEQNWKNTIPLLQSLEFKSLVTELSATLKPEDVGKKNTPNQANIFSEQTSEQQSLFAESRKALHEIYNFMCINNEQALVELCAKIREKKAFALDTETTGIESMLDLCVGISIAIETGTGYYIPFGHSTDAQQLSKEVVQKHLAPIFADNSIQKYLHHAKFDQIILHQAGMPLTGVAFDTLIAASLLVQDWQKKNLKVLSEFYFDETMLTYEEILAQTKAKNFSNVPLDLATHYAAADAHQTLKLYEIFNEELKKQNLDKLFYTIEMPINDILVAMQIEGIFCDKTVLEELDIFVTQDIQNIEKEIGLLTNEPINLNSPKQIKELLFDKLNLPPQKKSAKNTGFSTDAEVLKVLAKIHPIPGLLLKYRELYKLKSTYIESLPTYINPNTHKIHSSFNQTLVATGRLSSSNPNLQNIPTGDLGYKNTIRQAFKADQGQVFIAADYSQIELRILAHMSNDETLKQAFLNNQDIHKQTAVKIFNTTPEEVTSLQRGIGKTINFSILYGLTSYGLSKDLEIPYKDAQKYIAAYFEQYPGIVTWMDSIVEFTKTHGYTQTLFGRKRYIPGIYEKNKSLYELAKRIAINSAVQGTAAEIMKIGMIKLQKNLDDAGLQAKILLQIHDELILTVPESELEQTQALVKESLESVVSWEIPLTVQTKIGATWEQASK